MTMRWKDFLIAFLMAAVLWYAVSGSEKVETQVDVRLDYRGLPQGLVVRSGQVNKVSVRIRAPIGLLRSVSGREVAFFMDLSDVRKGENVLAVNLTDLPFRSGVEVIDVSPSRITLSVDSIETKVLPLEADISGTLPKDYVATATFRPAEVRVTGPSTLLEDMDKLYVPVAVESPIIPGTTEFKRLVPVPEGVDVSPLDTNVSLHIGWKRKQVTVSRTVRVDAPDNVGKFVRPDKVSVTLGIPESLAAKAGSNADIKATATLESTDLGSYTLPVQISLPAGAELIEVNPPRVTVTLEQKQPSRR